MNPEQVHSVESEREPRKITDILPFLNLSEGQQREFTQEEERAFNDARAAIAKQLGYEVVSNADKFLVLKKDGAEITLRHFMNPSKLSLDNGRISEIQIRIGDEEYNYGRQDVGWVGKKPNRKLMGLVDELAAYLN